MDGRVIFRKWKEVGDIIAFLPDVQANPYRMMSYMHIGQHSEADYYALLNETVLAEPEEYKDLLVELQSIGYDVIPRKKLECSPRRTQWLKGKEI